MIYSVQTPYVGPVLNDPVPDKHSTTAPCGLCGGVVDCSESMCWAAVGEYSTLKIIHSQHIRCVEE